MRELVVDLAAIRQNVMAIAERIAPARLMAVVKANGYGHGMVPVARAMAEAGAHEFGVVDVDEARTLRDAGITQPILAWLHGSDADLRWAVAAEVEFGVGTVDTLDRVASAAAEVRAQAPAAGTPLPRAIVHLETDSGLGRGGALGADWAALIARAVEHERAGTIRVRGIWTHLANASPDSDEAQFTAFDDAVAAARAAGLAPEIEHAASSASMVAHPDRARGMVRVGLSLYGLSPTGDLAGLTLRPAMEVAAEVVAVKRVPAGHGVSYGHEYVTDRETTLALVPVGYADGLPRPASGRGPVTVGGARFQVAGIIAMDQIVLDVGDADVAVGDRAVIWGDPADGVPSADDWAEAASTISYEIVTRVGPRLRRRYLD